MNSCSKNNSKVFQELSDPLMKVNKPIQTKQTKEGTGKENQANYAKREENKKLIKRTEKMTESSSNW